MSEEFNPEEIFAKGGSVKAIEAVKAKYADFVPDVSTRKGREEIASQAFSVAKKKNEIDKLGKEHVACLKAQAAIVDGERKVIWDTLEALQHQIRKPLTEFETREKARVAMIEEQLAGLVALTRFDASPSADEIAARIRALEMSNFNEWEEFQDRADKARVEAVTSLGVMLADARKREAEQAELARLRAAEEARIQKEREEAIAREAAAAAKAEADRVAAQEAAKAEAARLAVLAEKAAAEARLAKAEADAKAAAEKAEADRIAAAEKAARDAQAAVEAERLRIAAEKVAADRLTAMREADRAHRAKINSAAALALVEAGLEPDAARTAIIAIASGNVPNVKINY